MRRTRVIPLLLIHRGGLYKTSKFKNPTYIGDPINAIHLFNSMEVDEIIVLDIDASKHKRDPNYEMLEELVSEAFMPFSYGGGITQVEQAKKILQCGIEKVILNHAVQENFDLITKCAEQFGSQSVVVSIDYKKKMFGDSVRFDHVNGRFLKKEVVQSAIISEKFGAGEILINSVDRDGVMAGLDIKMIKKVSDAVNVPLIACGGAGSLDHLQAAEQAGASAIAAGSMFVFYGKQKGVLINYPEESIIRKYLN
jgi:cyclase